MTRIGILVVFAAFIAQSAASETAARPPVQTACEQVSADALTDPAVGEICAGDDAVRRASAAARDSLDRKHAWESAADHYRKAARSPKLSTKVLALNSLVNVCGPAQLDDAKQAEAALRDLMALTPNDLSPVFRLARLQETQGRTDAAEEMLLGARRQQPDASEPYAVLAGFYSRLASARMKGRDSLGAFPVAATSGTQPVRVGGNIAPPVKVTDVRPKYPPEAFAAGVQGVVIVEATINEAGNVTDAKVLRSIPLLDGAALDAVRQWQFTPTSLNGQAVPVIMTVTINFTHQ